MYKAERLHRKPDSDWGIYNIRVVLTKGKFVAMELLRACKENVMSLGQKRIPVVDLVSHSCHLKTVCSQKFYRHKILLIVL